MAAASIDAAKADQVSDDDVRGLVDALVRELGTGAVLADDNFNAAWICVLKNWVEQQRLSQTPDSMEADSAALAEFLVGISEDFNACGSYTNQLQALQNLVPNAPLQAPPGAAAAGAAVPVADSWQAARLQPPEEALEGAVSWMQQEVEQRVDELLRPFRTVLETAKELEQIQGHDSNMAEEHLRQALQAVTEARTRVRTAEQAFLRVRMESYVHHLAMSRLLLMGKEHLSVEARQEIVSNTCTPSTSSLTQSQSRP